MTEFERLKYAHKYIQDLANGVEPISGSELPNDTCLNNVRLSRCFFFVADILKQVIDNGGSIGGKSKGGEFILTDDFKARLAPNDTQLQISEFIKPINEIGNEYGMKKITTTAFTEWLVEKGYMEEKIYNNKRRKEPTLSGNNIGILTEQRNSMYGPGTYNAVLYTPQAQKFILDNIDEIVERWKYKPSPSL